MITTHYPVPSRPVELLDPDNRSGRVFSGITVDNRTKLNEEKYYQEKLEEALKRGSERRFIDDSRRELDSPNSELDETPDQFLEFHIHDGGDRKISRPETAASATSDKALEYDDLFVDRKQPKKATTHVKQFIRQNVFQKKAHLPNIGARELELQKRIALLEGPIDDDDIMSAMPMVACSSDYYDSHEYSTPSRALQSSSTSNPSSPLSEKEEYVTPIVEQGKTDDVPKDDAYGIGNLVSDTACKVFNYIFPLDSSSDTTTAQALDKALPSPPTSSLSGPHLEYDRPISSHPRIETSPLYSYMTPKSSNRNQMISLKAFKRPFSKKSNSSAVSLNRMEQNQTQLAPARPIWRSNENEGLEFINKAPRSKVEDFYNFINKTSKKKSKKNKFLFPDASQESLSFDYKYNKNGEGVTLDASFKRASETEYESYSYSSTTRTEEKSHVQSRRLRVRMPSFMRPLSSITADQCRERDNSSFQAVSQSASHIQPPPPASTDPNILSNIHMMIGSVPYFRIVFRPLTLLSEAMPQLQNVVIIAELVICLILLYEIHVFLGNVKLLLTAIFGPIIAISKLFS